MSKSALLLLMSVAGCGLFARFQKTETTEKAAEKPVAPVAEEKPRIEFEGDVVWASLAGDRWKLPAPKDELFFSPSQNKYAMVDLESAPDAPPTRMLIRSLRGRILSQILMKQPGVPREIAWIDERRIGYIEPKGALHPTDVYRVHDSNNGGLINERPGNSFSWDPAKKKVAYLSREGRAVAVGDKEIYPRTRTPRARYRGPIAWSADGRGLAFIELGEQPKLVVLVELEDESGDLSWPIPPEATGPSMKVFWAAPNKVVIGDDPLNPKFAAPWERDK
jgi:hypothetical protein